MLVLVLFAASVINGTRSAGRLSQTPYPQQGQEITDYCTLEMYLILSGTSVTPEKEAQYLNGACTNFPGTFLHSNEDMESVGENATLYCDSTVTLGQVLDAATDSHVWYFIEKNAAGGYDGNLCCFVGDSVIDFYVTVWFEGENALVQLSNRCFTLPLRQARMTTVITPLPSRAQPFEMGVRLCRSLVAPGRRECPAGMLYSW